MSGHALSATGQRRDRSDPADAEENTIHVAKPKLNRALPGETFFRFFEKKKLNCLAGCVELSGAFRDFVPARAATTAACGGAKKAHFLEIFPHPISSINCVCGAEVTVILCVGTVVRTAPVKRCWYTFEQL